MRIGKKIFVEFSGMWLFLKGLVNLIFIYKCNLFSGIQVDSTIEHGRLI